ncbi:hypothetical protein B0J11DRAFT_344171 [Dendryphion nanum]|uniref:Secreted protein n=1 Tax=Dendryphion nanum TaxID=256645 RepID=A0A9P9DND4_9PLEO|nr:hypothetical protein B0J11DRAFT_344171 [Dendryphion nanum]
MYPCVCSVRAVSLCLSMYLLLLCVNSLPPFPPSRFPLHQTNNRYPPPHRLEKQQDNGKNTPLASLPNRLDEAGYCGWADDHPLDTASIL